MSQQLIKNLKKNKEGERKFLNSKRHRKTKKNKHYKVFMKNQRK